MKRIDAADVMAPDATSDYTRHRSYRVHLGNKHVCSFDSARDANAFRAATNRMLNEVLLEVNALHGQAYHDYRMAWPALFHKGSPILGDLDRKLQLALNATYGALDRAARGTDGPNRMHFAWNHLNTAVDATKHTNDLLAQFYRYKTQGIWRQQAQIRSKHCEMISERLRSYGFTAGTQGQHGR